MIHYLLKRLICHFKRKNYLYGKLLRITILMSYLGLYKVIEHICKCIKDSREKTEISINLNTLFFLQIFKLCTHKSLMSVFHIFLTNSTINHGCIQFGMSQ